MNNEIHNDYNEATPSRYSAIQSFPEWISKIPADIEKNGHAELFDDGRIKWLIQQSGSIKDFNIMELGPFEGGHTYMLHNQGPNRLDAIEAKRDFYLKCLCIKEAFHLKNANFYLGSFVKWLKQPGIHYDMIVASGVLYHMTDPVELLDLISERTSRVFLWTHYAPKEMYPDNHPLRAAYASKEVSYHKGSPVTVHKRTYLNASQNPTFCGGVRDDHSWLEKEGIIEILQRNGFQNIKMEDQENHPNGPCFSLYAEK